MDATTRRRVISQCFEELAILEASVESPHMYRDPADIRDCLESIHKIEQRLNLLDRASQ